MNSATSSKRKQVIAVLPAYNAARTLKRTVDDIPKDLVNDILLVDDASRDNTVEVARELGLKTIQHKKNRGYGGNQKTCYTNALAMGADIVVMVHPDHQYDPKAIPELVRPILEGRADAVFGSRMMIKGRALSGGMPRWKFFANIILTKLENAVLRLSLTEYHSGFRAYSRRALETVPFEKNSDDFVFDTEIIVQLKIAKLHIEEIPIQTRYFPEASMIGLKRSITYGMGILKTLLKYVLYMLGIARYAQFEISV